MLVIRANAAGLVTVVVFAQVIELVPTFGVNVIISPSTPVPIPVPSVRAMAPSVTVAEATSFVGLNIGIPDEPVSHAVRTPPFSCAHNPTAVFKDELEEFVLRLSETLQTSWMFVLLGIGTSLIAFREARFRAQKFAYMLDKYMLRLPVMGNIVYNSIIARFARTLATTFSAGVPIVDALKSVAGAAGNRLYYDAIMQVREDVMTGIQLQQAIKMRKMFPTLLHQMAAIGEESGALDEMLEKAALHYEEEVDNSVDNLTSLLEPVIMTVLGVLVGSLLIAMYLPIFQLGNVV